jgi:hypothetical protein
MSEGHSGIKYITGVCVTIFGITHMIRNPVKTFQEREMVKTSLIEQLYHLRIVDAKCNGLPTPA